jgi:hypothetical protein
MHHWHHHPGGRGRKILKMLVLAAIAIPAIGFLVMSLWNALMPAIFGLPALGFWQALGLLVLSKILFGGFHGGGHHHKHRMMHERWAAMSEEEREKFRRAMGRNAPRDDGGDHPAQG